MTLTRWLLYYSIDRSGHSFTAGISEPVEINDVDLLLVVNQTSRYYYSLSLENCFPCFSPRPSVQLGGPSPKEYRNHTLVDTQISLPV